MTSTKKSTLTRFTEQISSRVSSNPTHLSVEFVELIKNIGEAKSKQEEDRIIRNEAERLEDVLNKPEASVMFEFQISKKINFFTFFFTFFFQF